MSTLTKSTIFPNPNKSKYTIVVVNNSDVLPSAICDGQHLATLFNEVIKMTHIYIVVDSMLGMKKISDSLKRYSNISYLYLPTKMDALSTITIIVGSLYECDLIITISSHGYANGDINYINYNGSTIYDYEINRAVLAKMQKSVNCFVLIDACQSGTGLNLNYKTIDLITYSAENPSSDNHNIVCISAVSDYQYDEDDISDLGFDGGLTAAFIDYNMENVDAYTSIGGFYKYYNDKMKKCGRQPILSFNNIDFMKD
jgi:hypothetical protein